MFPAGRGRKISGDELVVFHKSVCYDRNMDEREQKIEKLKEYFAKRDDVVMAFLFGSQASGRVHTESDWDIAVYFKPEVVPIEYQEQRREYPEEEKVWNDCTHILQMNTDLIVLNRVYATTADVALSGIPLVIKNRALFIEFMLRVWREAEDFRQTTREYADIYWRSASLTTQDVYSLDRRLIFIDNELNVMKEFTDTDWIEYQKNHQKRRIVERTIENLMNALIDVAKIILASEKQEVPHTYREMLQHVGFIKPFSQEITERLAGWADLRNILAHEYLDFRWKPISDFLAHHESFFRSFLKVARVFLEENQKSP